MYIDEVSDYIDRDGDRGALLSGTWIPLLLYADDLVLISESPEGLQSQLDTLARYTQDRDLTVNLNKTKVMIFNTTTNWVNTSAPVFLYGEEEVELTKQYTYLGVVFTGPSFSMREAACSY